MCLPFQDLNILLGFMTLVGVIGLALVVISAGPYKNADRIKRTGVRVMLMALVVAAASGASWIAFFRC